jgi:hypothetical protein
MAVNNTSSNNKSRRWSHVSVGSTFFQKVHLQQFHKPQRYPDISVGTAFSHAQTQIHAECLTLLSGKRIEVDPSTTNITTNNKHDIPREVEKATNSSGMN